MTLELKTFKCIIICKYFTKDYILYAFTLHPKAYILVSRYVIKGAKLECLREKWPQMSKSYLI